MDPVEDDEELTPEQCDTLDRLYAEHMEDQDPQDAQDAAEDCQS
jgi:hypothetical protein